jgi:hypothetical protein
MEIASVNVPVPLRTSVFISGGAISVSLEVGGCEAARAIVSLDSLLQEHLDMHEFYRGGGYSREVLSDLFQLRKLVDSYIRKVKASPAKSAASRTRGSRPYARGK